MNVLITNKQESILSGLDVEIIKTMRGEFDAEEIIGTFSNFFFGRMILDLTAIRDYNNISNIQKLSIGLPVEKIILVLPSGGEYSSNIFLSKLISMGFYNFTTNLEGVKYLLENPNTYKDVAHLQQLETPIQPAMIMPQEHTTTEIESPQVISIPQIRIIGFKNITDQAGATTLIVRMKKELEKYHGLNVKAIEVGKRDFTYFNDNTLVSINKAEFLPELSRSGGYDLVLIDMNDLDENSVSEIYYLIEPSIIKINKIVKRDREAFNRLKDKKIVINKSMISNDDIAEFAGESGLKIFSAIRPFNDRSNDAVLTNFLTRIGVIHVNN
ncbi:MAG: hypothetical protein IKQ35_03380 [Bacilli bacterium]|nr:hypothetical protein [Bacilli bacterium]